LFERNLETHGTDIVQNTTTNMMYSHNVSSFMRLPSDVGIVPLSRFDSKSLEKYYIRNVRMSPFLARMAKNYAYKYSNSFSPPREEGMVPVSLFM
jgi:hypothetical protein